MYTQEDKLGSIIMWALGNYLVIMKKINDKCILYFEFM